MPLVTATRAKLGPNLLSLSRIRYLGACPYGVASRSCCAVQASVGERPHVLLDRPLAHPYVQLQEFTPDPFSTPQSILRRHLPDQGDGLGGDLGLARSGLGLVLPVQAKELPMPPEQGVWLHDHEGLLPSLNQPGQQDQEHAIGSSESWPFHLSPQNDELLS